MPKFDGAEVQSSCNENELIIDNLNIITDEIYIEEAMRGYGAIKEV